jgi:hypothetical protein
LLGAGLAALIAGTLTAGVLTIGTTADAGATTTAKSASCAKGTKANEGACIETHLRPDPLSWREANRFCLDKHRRLPSLAELQTLFDRTSTDASSTEWYNLRYRAAGEELAGVVSGDGEVDSATASTLQVYRCVAARS